MPLEISYVSAEWLSASVAVVSAIISIVALMVSVLSVRYARKQASAADRAVEVAMDAELEADRAASAAELDVVRQEQRALDEQRQIRILVGIENRHVAWEVRAPDDDVVMDGRLHEPFDTRLNDHCSLRVGASLRGVLINEDARAVLVSVSPLDALTGGTTRLLPSSLAEGGALPPPLFFGANGEILLSPGQALIIDTWLGASVASWARIWDSNYNREKLPSLVLQIQVAHRGQDSRAGVNVVIVRIDDWALERDDKNDPDGDHEMLVRRRNEVAFSITQFVWEEPVNSFGELVEQIEKHGVRQPG
ncbi:hypothetical protein LUW76_30945 [Actinomadura madurae]|uniref:hypothetical protein n=1 Tax=Actinomadura madurae TaxID=1993 RepID=UPI0020273D92|nr:hypothetical protein [Actinomadura madurae]URM98409.1 hypothetical protein LUW76_30945 [Actinomadura madurae]